MTISLHWWMLPAEIMVIGLYQSFTIKGTGDYLDGMDNAVWFFGSLIVSVALIVGHFL